MSREGAVTTPIFSVVAALMIAYVATGTVIELLYAANDNVPQGDEGAPVGTRAPSPRPHSTFVHAG